MKTLLVIDGENLKGKIKAVFDDVKIVRPEWYQYDHRGLFDKVLNGFLVDEMIFYFARIKEHEKSKVKSRLLIEEQRKLKTHLENQGFKVILSGRVRGQLEESSSGKSLLVFREKGVDVKMAVDMVSNVCDSKAKEIILCSSDSDLQPAISEVTRRGASCIYLGFEIKPNKGISYTTKRTILIRNSEVIEFMVIKTKCLYPQISKDLEEMVLKGQEMRDKNREDSNYWNSGIDKNNSVRLKEIIKEIGFPSISKVGKEGMKNAWLIVQHSDHDVSFQESCLDLMKKAEDGEIEKKYIAYLEDRIRIEKKQLQVYGTQFKKADNKWLPLPIEDEANVDKRRAQMGMDTLTDQIRLMEEKG